MTPPILRREQSRRLDQRAQEEFGVSGLVLMENAGRGVTDALVRLGATSRVAICCGKGNNAGDGFVIARHLDLRGIEVRLILFHEPTELQGDALVNYEIAQRSGLSIDVFPAYDELVLETALDGTSWIVDALLGTGAQGTPREPLASVIDHVNRHSAPILAVDLPSGFDGDSGQASEHTMRARHTCTFVACKPGFLAEGAAEFTGRVEVVDNGAPGRLVREMLAKANDTT